MNISKQKVLLLINGPMLSGKTTLTKKFCEDYDGFVRISTDSIKWFISKYTNDMHTGLKNMLALKLADAAISENMSVIVESNAYIQKNLIGKYKELADKNNIRFIIVNLEIDYKTSRKRFYERLEKGLNVAEGTPILINKESQMRYRYMTFKKCKCKTDIKFNTDKQTTDYIIEKIVTFLKDKSDEKTYRESRRIREAVL